jgi:hypothetical protein
MTLCPTRRTLEEAPLFSAKLWVKPLQIPGRTALASETQRETSGERFAESTETHLS